MDFDRGSYARGVRTDCGFEGVAALMVAVERHVRGEPAECESRSLIVTTTAPSSRQRWNVTRNRIVERQNAALDLAHHQRRRREDLGERGEIEDGVVACRRRTPDRTSDGRTPRATAAGASRRPRWRRRERHDRRSPAAGSRVPRRSATPSASSVGAAEERVGGEHDGSARPRPAADAVHEPGLHPVRPVLERLGECAAGV